MPPEISVRKDPPRRWAGVRRTVRAPEIGAFCSEVLPRIARQLEAHGVPMHGPPVIVYHAHDEAAGAFDMTAGFFVPADATVEGLDVGEIGPGSAAWTTHRGPYHLLGDAHGAIRDWTDSHGWRPRGPCFDVYVDDPGAVAETELRTEVVWPVWR